MAVESKSENRIVTKVVRADSILEVIEHRVVTGTEHDELEAHVQALIDRGRHVVDYNLTIDTQLKPPAYGWIVHRETTK